MKRYRFLFPIVLVVLFGASCYTMVNTAAQKAGTVSSLVATAQSYAEQKLYDKAADTYTELIEEESKADYYLAVIDMYLEAEDYSNAYSWCKDMLSAYPKVAEGYERMLATCLAQEKYTYAYEALDDFDGRGLSSDVVEGYRAEMKFLYFRDYLSYDDISQPSGSYVGFTVKEKWGLTTVKGATKVSAKFQSIGYYANGLVAVCDTDGDWYLMDATGEYCYNISNLLSGEITEVGLYASDYIPICVDGTYSYYDLGFNSHFGTFLYAGSFSSGVAAVQTAEGWRLMDDQGNYLTSAVYDDVILDDRGICCQKERIFVQQDGAYYMVNLSGERVGSLEFEDAVLFSTDGYAAVKIASLWGFVDTDGAMVMEPAYEEAKSFSLGLAAVSDGLLWGYISLDGTLVIDYTYTQALTFTSSGTAFVHDGSSWSLLKLYEYFH